MSRTPKLLVVAAFLSGLAAVSAAGTAWAGAAPFTDASSLGPARLINGQGQTVIGGPTDVPFGYLVSAVVGTGSAPAGWRGDDALATSTAAVAGIWTPVSGAAANTWSGNPLGASTQQPNPRTVPRGAVAPSTPTLEQAVLAGGGASMGAEAGFYEIRLLSVTDDAGSATSYYTVDLKVDQAAHRFTVVGPGEVPAGVQATAVPRPDTRKQQAPVAAEPVSVVGSAVKTSTARLPGAATASTAAGAPGGSTPAAAGTPKATTTASADSAAAPAPTVGAAAGPGPLTGPSEVDRADAAAATRAPSHLWPLAGSAIAALAVVLSFAIWRRRRRSHT